MVIEKSRKRALICLVAFSVILMTAMVVYAAIGGVDFIQPRTGYNISGTYNVQWWNNDTHDNKLQWGIGCETGTWDNLTGTIAIPNQNNFSWDTTGKSGTYCLRIYAGPDNITYSGNFTIDNTAPVANLSAGEPYSCNEGGWVILNASASNDSDTGIASYEWNNGSGYVSGSVAYNYTCGNGDSTPTVSLRVTDYANNTNTTSTTINISNVAPVCYGIASVGDTVVDQEVNFTANATDVIDTLTYAWDFNDTGTGTGNPGTHTFTTNGTYTVTVTVDDGETTCQNTTTINVHGVTTLLTQEAVALQNLTTDFNTKNGSASNSFTSGLTGAVVCTEISSTPATITNSSTDCVVTWNNINNSEQGTYTVNVQAYNGSDYEFYSFSIIVYSWKKDLVAGWNLISIPLVPSDTSIEEVFDGIIDNIVYDGSTYTVYQYNALDESWYKTRRYSSPSSGFYHGISKDIDDVVPGYAYWVKMNSSDTLYGFGNKSFGALQTPPSIDLGSSWNLIGKFGLVNVQKQNETNNLVFYDQPQLGDLADYQVTDSDGTTLGDTGNLAPANGYWVLLGGNSGNPIEYSPSIADYNFS